MILEDWRVVDYSGSLYLELWHTKCTKYRAHCTPWKPGRWSCTNCGEIAPKQIHDMILLSRKPFYHEVFADLRRNQNG